MVENQLNHFKGLAACPVCGCLERHGTMRCPECGTFHSGSIMQERDPPPASERMDEERTDVDPRNYSLGPNHNAPDETFEQSDDVKTWDGGSSDFTFEDDEQPIHIEKPQLAVPEPEILNDEN